MRFIDPSNPAYLSRDPIPLTFVGSPLLWWRSRQFQTTAVAVASIMYVVIVTFNAVLTLDDPVLIVRFGELLERQGWIRTLEGLFLGLDLSNEYRLYGLSRVIHFCLWRVFGTHAFAYAATIALLQLATAHGIYILITRLGFERVRAGCLAALWLLSPFAATSCFHHYSYLVLPYSFTVACALLLQKLHRGGSAYVIYPVVTVLGLAIAWSGEAHLLASVAIVTCVGFATPSLRSRVQRCRDIAVPISAIAVGILFHRLMWMAYGPSLQGYSRFVPEHTTIEMATTHFRVFLRSLELGMRQQLHPIMEMGGVWVVTAAVLLSAGLVQAQVFRSSSGFAPHRIGLSLGLLLIFMASLAVYGLLAVVTPEAFGWILPRRYGFVPNTLLLMLIGAIATEPRFRHNLNIAPAILCALVTAFWIALEVICIPAIRNQDRLILDGIKLAVARSEQPRIFFADAWEPWTRPDYKPGGPTPGIRGVRFPEIFESPFEAYWIEASYVSIFFGPNRTAYRAVIEGENKVAVDIWPYDATRVVIPAQSLTVVANASKMPVLWKYALPSVTITQGDKAIETISRLSVR